MTTSRKVLIGIGLAIALVMLMFVANRTARVLQASADNERRALIAADQLCDAVMYGEPSALQVQKGFEPAVAFARWDDLQAVLEVGYANPEASDVSNAYYIYRGHMLREVEASIDEGRRIDWSAPVGEESRADLTEACRVLNDANNPREYYGYG